MSLQELIDLNDELHQSIKELNSEFDKKHPTLIRKISELKDITNGLEGMHKITTTGSLVGSSMGAAGGVTALVGLGLSFFTFGASLAITAVGVGVGVAGGVTGATCNITNMIQQKKLRQTIENIINDFQKAIEPMIQHLGTISNKIEKLQQVGHNYSVVNKAIMTSVRSVKTVSSITKLLAVLRTAIIGKTAAKAATTLKVVGKVSGTISTLFLALDVYSIYCDSVELSEMNENKRKEEIKSETLKFIHHMRETSEQLQATLEGIKSARNDISEVARQLKQSLN